MRTTLTEGETDSATVADDTELSQLLGLSVAQFDAEIRGRASHVARGGADHLGGLLDWPKVNRLLRTAGRQTQHVQVSREHSRLAKDRFVKGGSTVDAGCINFPAVMGAVHQGYSVILDRLHLYDEGIQGLAARLSRELREFVGINAYVSWSADKCFLTHWDNHDVLIVQTEGSKKWSVFKQTRPFPMSRDIDYNEVKNDLELVWEDVLRKGDVLYIPRGWWHHAQAEDAGSIHLTCGFTNPTAMDLLRVVGDALCRNPENRRDLDRPVLEGVCVDSDGAQATALLAEIAAMDPLAITREFWRQHFATMALEQGDFMPLLASEELLLEANPLVQFAGFGPLLLQPLDDAAAIAIEGGGRRWEVDVRCRPCLTRLNQAGTLRLSDLVEGDDALSRDEVVQLVFELANEGILIVKG